jgi:molybdopterin-binding protein|tara:strand:- start:480 stop:1514 length:1035 start_codon:yes stop_codon:yes gene_type:complete
MSIDQATEQGVPVPLSFAYELNDVVQAYSGTPVLQIAECHIEADRITALVGPNGSGKSTLLNLLSFIDSPDEGHLHFFGDTVPTTGTEAFRHHIGYVQQKPYLLNTTVFRNVELGLKLRKVEKSQRRKQVLQFLDEFGITHLAERRAHELSGGEVQKVAIARALVLTPRVLILDEPFSHLDTRFHLEFESLLRGMRERSQTVIFSTHDRFQALALADSVCTLLDGHLMPISEVNLFTGRLDRARNMFVTRQLEVNVPKLASEGTRLSIDSRQLVINGTAAEPGMRNNFPGTVQAIRHEAGEIHIDVMARELFHAVITRQVLNELRVQVGDPVWVSFKASAVSIF